jgi:hypothetical protein
MTRRSSKEALPRAAALKDWANVEELIQKNRAVTIALGGALG